MNAAPVVRPFPFESGESPKITADKVARCVELLKATGYKTALFARDFKPGTFVIEVTAEGYAVKFQTLSGLAPVAA